MSKYSMQYQPHAIIEEAGNVKYVYHVHEQRVNLAVKEFTSSPREWTAYPADRIEVILRHNNFIPQNAHYARYLEDSQVLVFVVNNRSHGEPRWLEQTKGFIKRLFS